MRNLMEKKRREFASIHIFKVGVVEDIIKFTGILMCGIVNPHVVFGVAVVGGKVVEIVHFDNQSKLFA